MSPDLLQNIRIDEQFSSNQPQNRDITSRDVSPFSRSATGLDDDGKTASANTEISAKSAVQSSNPNSSSVSPKKPNPKFAGLKYKGRLPITEVNELVDLCEEFIRSKNVTGLAMVARQRGLPPSLRHKIWPVLLKYHPYVLDPYIQPDYEEEEDDDEDDDNPANDTDKEEIPIQKIKFDLNKYVRNAERYKPKTLNPDLKDLFEIQDKIFYTIEMAIAKFLKKWGSIVHYNSGLTWIALGLAEWVPPLPDSQFVLCGKDDVAKNGTKLRNLNDDEFEKLEHGSEATFNSTSSTIDSTPLLSTSPKSISSFESVSASSITDNNSYPFKSMTFAEVYERLVLVILHTPDPSIKNGLKATSSNTSSSSDSSEKEYTDDLPKLGGSIEDRISFFLYCLRKLLPELQKFLSDEDSLKGDWILWWLKYGGSKVWSRYDRGRVWDMILGFRIDCAKFEKDLKQLRTLSDETIRLLGPDLFWNPMIDNDDNDSTTTGGSAAMVYKGRSSSIKTLLNQVSFGSVDRTPTLSSLAIKSDLSDEDADIEPITDLPFSQIDPHIQLIFISIAFLKSKEFTIMELDQSEIKQLLNRLSSLKTSEIRSFVGGSRVDDKRVVESNTSNSVSGNNSSINVNTGTGIATSNPPSNHSGTPSLYDLSSNGGGCCPACGNVGCAVCSASSSAHHKKSNRDIENIIVEAGELWRRFIYTEMIEDR